METIAGFGLLAALIGAMFGALLPRFSAYFLGPLFLIIAASAGFGLFTANLHTEGSPAGLIVGGLLMLAVVIGAPGGLALTIVGTLRMRKRGDEVPPPP